MLKSGFIDNAVKRFRRHYLRNCFAKAVVEAQLAERSLPTPEAREVRIQSLQIFV